MSVSLSIDATAFNGALQRYLGETSKSAEAALNGKMKDLMYKSTRYTPKMEPRGKVRNVAALAAWRLRTLRGGIASAADFAREMARVKKPAVGYMKSAFAKAGDIFKTTAASSEKKPSGNYKHGGTIGRGLHATINSLLAQSEAVWTSMDGRDRSQKQEIAETAFGEAVNEVTRDMLQYLAKKMQKHAQEVSAR